MTSILGIVIVFACIAGGYLMEHGKLLVLIQPAELVIILGSAVGASVAANPVPVLIRTWEAMAGLLSGSLYKKRFYAESLPMIYDLFSSARKMGRYRGSIEERCLQELPEI